MGPEPAVKDDPTPAAAAAPPPPSAPRPALPWYSFLYRLFGAQGTFILWMLAVPTLWWSFDGFLIRLANQRPQERAPDQIAEAAGIHLVRWVKVHGLELTLDQNLLLSKKEPELGPAVLVVDPRDPSVEHWTTARRLAEEIAAGGSGALTAKKALTSLMLGVEGAPAEWIPTAERSIVIQDERVRPLDQIELERTQGQTGLATGFDRDLERFQRLLLERVRPNVTHEGLLLDLPGSVAQRLKSVHHGLVVAPYVLQPGKQPRQLESILFAVSATLLVFLAGGLWGARRVAVENGAAS